MKTSLTILLAILLSVLPRTNIQAQQSSFNLDFFGDPLSFSIDHSLNIPSSKEISFSAVNQFFQEINKANYQDLVSEMLQYKKQYVFDDWVYYQLVRRVAQQLSPKNENYTRYTLYKWFLMLKSGYDVKLKVSEQKILFYVRSRENIYDIPSFIKDGNQYVCLNFHDYNYQVNFTLENFREIDITENTALNYFSYKVTSLPNFHPGDYHEKQISFNVNDNEYNFRVKLNKAIPLLFNNYPVVDYASYFNIPLSRETYNSLIPALKNSVKGLNVKNGVDYLMRFTRYAFSYARDIDIFGKEKRLSPEQTLLFEKSDCEDRSALFFMLVKEIYNLPMIVLAYPEHVTIAVRFPKASGQAIIYNNERYYICEPTPQKEDLRIGEISSQYSKQHFEIVYAYQPITISADSHK